MHEFRHQATTQPLSSVISPNLPHFFALRFMQHPRASDVDIYFSQLPGLCRQAGWLSRSQHQPAEHQMRHHFCIFFNPDIYVATVIQLRLLKRYSDCLRTWNSDRSSKSTVIAFSGLNHRITRINTRTNIVNASWRGEWHNHRSCYGSTVGFC